MMEVIVFALTLVAAQIVGGFIAMRLIMNKKFVKKFATDYAKLTVEIAQELEEEFGNL